MEQFERYLPQDILLHRQKCKGTAAPRSDNAHTDVRCRRASGVACTPALVDYTGSLETQISGIRVPDRNRGAGGATLEDITMRFAVPGVTTGDTTVGSIRTVTASIDAVLGGARVIAEQKRAIWQIPDVTVLDGEAPTHRGPRTETTLRTP